MHTIRLAPRSLVAAAALTAGAASALASVPLNLIALSGQPAPGQPVGVLFKNFDQPRLGAVSHGAPLTFLAVLEGPGMTSANNLVVYSTRSGGLVPVYATGAEAPWYTATPFVAFPEISADAAGAISFLGVVADTGLPPNSSLEAKHAGVFTETSPGLLTPLAREGEAIAAYPSLVWNNMTVPQATSGGTLAFWSGLPGMVWSTRTGSLDAPHAVGDQLPGMSPAESAAHITTPTQGAGGDLVFHAQRVESDPRFPTGTGLWIDRAGTPAALAISGTTAPDGESTYHQLAPRAAVDAHGNAVFHATLADDAARRHALILDAAVSQTLLAVQGDPCPAFAGDVRYHTLSTSPAINDCGTVAFLASLTGADTDASNNSAILTRTTSGSLVSMLREGTPVPGHSGFVIDSLGDPTLLSSGSIVVMAHAHDQLAVNTGREVLLAIPRPGQPVVLAMSRGTLEVAPGDARTVDAVNWVGGNPASGVTQASTDGSIAFTVRFAGGSHALYTASIPAPADLNLDGIVDVLDFLDFFQAFSDCENAPAPCPGDGLDIDLDASGTVDILDFLRFFELFDGNC